MFIEQRKGGELAARRRSLYHIHETSENAHPITAEIHIMYSIIVNDEFFARRQQVGS